MTERKFTDEEVIKALECCANGECDECPYQESSPCKEYLNNAALDLINRQRAEIDDLTRDTIPKLKNGLERANKYGAELEKELAEAKAEIERLKAGKRSIKELADELCNRIGETGITDYNTYLRVAGLIQKVMGSPCTEGADCFAAEGKE